MGPSFPLLKIGELPPGLDVNQHPSTLRYMSVNIKKFLFMVLQISMQLKCIETKSWLCNQPILCGGDCECLGLVNVFIYLYFA